MAYREPSLEVLICTFGEDGGRKVAAMLLPPADGISYLVSWQGDCPKLIPEELAQRTDVTVLLISGKGLSRNRNNCLDHASGDILLIADDDLTLLPSGLQQIREIFAANPSLEYASFRFELSHCEAKSQSIWPKPYPSEPSPLAQLPKGFYQSSIEIALRRNSRAGALRFNENFGIGAPFFGAGEEELLLKRARILGLDCRFFPVTVARHNSPTTGSQTSLSDAALRSRGAITAVEYPLTSLLRIPLNSWRICRNVQASLHRALYQQLIGAFHSLFSVDLRNYLHSPLSQTCQSPQNSQSQAKGFPTSIEVQSSQQSCARSVSSENPKAPQLSVVLPVHNRASIVRRTLQTLAAQTLRPLAVILVDNNSSDDSLKILNQWKETHEAPDFKITILREPIPGAAAARNRGLESVDTPYVMFFDSDDLMDSTHCQRILDGFRSNPDVDIVGWDIVLNFNGHKSIKHFYSRNPHWHNIHSGSMATQRYAARTELFRSAGLWNQHCMGWNDIEIGSRLLLKAHKIVKLRGSHTVEVIFTPSSITGSSFSSGAEKWHNSLRLIEHTYRHAPLSVSFTSRLRSTILHSINLRRAILAADYRLEGSRALASTLMAETLANEPSLYYRTLCRFAFRWRSAGLPGIARLLRPLF